MNCCDRLQTWNFKPSIFMVISQNAASWSTDSNTTSPRAELRRRTRYQHFSIPSGCEPRHGPEFGLTKSLNQSSPNTHPARRLDGIATFPQFEIIIGISLKSSCRFRFKPYRHEGKIVATSLEPRSAYILRGAARWQYQHSIPAVKALRYSITFRTWRSKVPARRKTSATDFLL
jgi:hypothetical protein